MKENVREILISALHDADDYLSGEQMSGKLKISRTAIWKHIQQLKKSGYHIITARRKGYMLMSPPREFVVGEVKRQLNSKYMGRKIHYFPEVGSTNEKALEIARSEKNGEGVFVVSRLQRNGKGRRGRTWLSLPGGIWASGILHPVFLPAQAHLVTFAAAVAICEAIREVTSLDVEIKWPNDIVYQGRKMGGILSEIKSEIDKIHYLVIGFGINVNIRLSKFPQPLRGQATSIYRELKKEVSLSELFARIVEKLEVYYEYIQQQQVAELIKMWKKYDCTLGHEVAVTNQSGAVIKGVATNIDLSGALIVKTSDGKKQTLVCGDLVINQAA